LCLHLTWDVLYSYIVLLFSQREEDLDIVTISDAQRMYWEQIENIINPVFTVIQGNSFENASTSFVNLLLELQQLMCSEGSSDDSLAFVGQVESVFKIFCCLDANSPSNEQITEFTSRCIHLSSMIIRICLEIIRRALTSEQFIRRSKENFSALRLALQISGIVCTLASTFVENCRTILKLTLNTEESRHRLRLQTLEDEAVTPGTPALRAHAMAHINGHYGTGSTPGDSIVNLLSESVLLAGLLLLLPSEDEIKGSKILSAAVSQQPHDESDFLRGRMDAGGNNFGIGVSDRWWVLTLLLDVLAEKRLTVETSSAQIIPRLVLLLFKNIVANASHEFFNMLLAQHLPTALCDCIVPVAHDSDAFLSVPAAGASRGNSNANTPSASSRKPKATGTQTRFDTKYSPMCAFAFAAIAELVQPSQENWATVVPFPLEHVFHSHQNSGGSDGSQSDSSSTGNAPGNKHTADYESGSARLLLRKQIVRLIGERLIEGLGQRFNVLMKYLSLIHEGTDESEGRPQQAVAFGDRLNQLYDFKFIENYPVSSISVLKIVAHATNICGLYLSSSVSSYRDAIGIKAMIDLLQLPRGNKAVGTYEVNQKTALAMSVLRNLVASQCLTFPLAMQTVQATIFCICEASDVMCSMAGLDLLSCLLHKCVKLLRQQTAAELSKRNASSPAGPITTNYDDEIVEWSQDQVAALIGAVVKGVCSSQFLVCMRDVLCFSECNTSVACIFTRDRSNKTAVTNSSNPPPENSRNTNYYGSLETIRFVGNEFGQRRYGLLDGTLCLLACLGVHASTSLFKHVEVTEMAEYVCRHLQNASIGEMSPIGSLAALRFISAFLQQPAAAELVSLPQSSQQQQQQPQPLSQQTVRGLLFMRQRGLVGLVSLLCLPQHIDYVESWGGMMEAGVGYGNGHDSDYFDPVDLATNPADNHSETTDIITGVIDSSCQILKTYLSLNAVSSSCLDAVALTDAIGKTHLVKLFIETLRSHGPQLPDSSVACAVHVLSELVMSKEKFMTQFIESKGLQVIDDLPQRIFSCGMEVSSNHHLVGGGTGTMGRVTLKPASQGWGTAHTAGNSYRAEMLTSALQLASHLARNSDDFYGLLQSVFSPVKLMYMLLQVIMQEYSKLFL
jgi:hypothetical protein